MVVMASGALLRATPIITPEPKREREREAERQTEAPCLPSWLATNWRPESLRAGSCLQSSPSIQELAKCWHDHAAAGIHWAGKIVVTTLTPAGYIHICVYEQAVLVHTRARNNTNAISLVGTPSLAKRRGRGPVLNDAGH